MSKQRKSKKREDRVISVYVQSMPVHEKHWGDSGFVLICEQFRNRVNKDSHVVVRLHFDSSQIEDLAWKLRDQMQHEYEKLRDSSQALTDAGSIRARPPNPNGVAKPT